MNLMEIAKLQTFLQLRFGDTQLEVRPRPNDQETAEVCRGDECIGILVRDDDEDDLSYDFNMEIHEDTSDFKAVEAFLRARLKDQALEIRQRPNKEDSVEVYKGDEFIGVLFRNDDEDEVSYDFNMAILDIDLEEATGL